ncbi:MAG: hypothetical protein AAGH99_01200 [Planctomycetota bacterium]
MSSSLDSLMERASRLLAEMDYLGSEELCLEALARAKRDKNWNAYPRIVLPLQECRRQRRMIAADTAIQFGTNACWSDPRDGCVVVTAPLDRDTAERVAEKAAAEQRFVEVLWCRSEPYASKWTLEALGGLEISCTIPAPDEAWVYRRLTPGDEGFAAAGHWFIAATEALGDAAIESITAPLGSTERVDQFERVVEAIGDHELLHQRWADAVRAVAVGGPA